ncbi:MAG: hypothetical protein RLZZ561_719 [Pseudomonadota bacterium]|jgi:NodT family efflux transporter outer membrane factor (OMF) lipoprotein
MSTSSRSFSGRKLKNIIAILAVFAPVSSALAASAPADDWRRWVPSSFERQGKSADIAVAPSQKWLSEYKSAELDELVAIALAGNNQLNAAVARVTQAEARLRAANGGRAPTIDAIARATYRAPEFGVGTAPTRSDYSSRQIYQAGLRVAYEVDLWGRGAYRQEAAVQQLKSSRFAREALAQSLISDVATAYFSVLALRERVGLAKQNYETAQEIELVIERRAERGDLSIIDREQQSLATADAGAQLFQLREQLATAEGNLAFLLGRPLGMLQIAAPALLDVHVPDIAPGLPAAMVCRRPDIRRVEADLLAARADLGLARKGLLPSISLTAEGGYGTSNLSRALSPQSLFTDIVGQLVQSVFDGGRKKAAISEQTGRQKELLEAYRGTILAALRDTEEALAGVQLTQSRLALFSSASVRSSRLVSMTQRVFDRGALDYASLLESQRTQFRTADLAVIARLDRLKASVDLFKALGGGQSSEKDDCVSEALAASGVPEAQSNTQPASQKPAPPLQAVPAAKKKTSRW